MTWNDGSGKKFYYNCWCIDQLLNRNFRLALRLTPLNINYKLAMANIWLVPNGWNEHGRRKKYVRNKFLNEMRNIQFSSSFCFDAKQIRGDFLLLLLLYDHAAFLPVQFMIVDFVPEAHRNDFFFNFIPICESNHLYIALVQRAQTHKNFMKLCKALILPPKIYFVHEITKNIKLRTLENTFFACQIYGFL
jgi:hypothetical protein